MGIIWGYETGYAWYMIEKHRNILGRIRIQYIIILQYRDNMGMISVILIY